MKSRFMIAAALVLGATLAHAGELKWMTNFQQAAKLSKQTGKPILINFTGSDWCGWCHKLDNEVFSKKPFQSWANKKVILVEMDFPQRKPLPAALKQQNDYYQAKYKIEGFPTILLVNASGKVLGQMGYQEGGPKKWTQDADKFIGVR